MKRENTPETIGCVPGIRHLIPNLWLDIQKHVDDTFWGVVTAKFVNYSASLLLSPSLCITQRKAATKVRPRPRAMDREGVSRLVTEHGGIQGSDLDSG